MEEVDMEEAPLVAGMSSPEDEIATEIFRAGSPFASENVALMAPVVAKDEEDEFQVFKDAYLGPADPEGPLLHAFNPPLNADCEGDVRVELLADGAEVEHEELPGYPGLPGLHPLEDAVLPAAPQLPVYDEHFLSSLLTLHPSPAVEPLSAWARDGAAHAGVQVIPVGMKEASGAPLSDEPEEGTFQNPPAQEPCFKFPPSQEAEDASGLSLRKDSDPMLDNGTLPPTVSGSTLPPGSALPEPPRMTLARYCDCFASGDFCSNCNCNNCFNDLRHEMERFKAIKACLDRNPEAFRSNIGNGGLGDVRPRRDKGHDCRRPGCLKNRCECYEAKIMCSSICKSPERKSLLSMPNCTEAGDCEGSRHVSPTKFSGLAKFRKDRPASLCVSWDVVEAACACLLAQGEEAEKEQCSERLAEKRVLEEFGRCLSQILHTEFKSKESNTE
ncbi:tesmin isoform X1 [Manis javanica]|uniref:tesmin isoform X1 n=1 Tax=Manis javanica TaxID=9974 RepID=UPI003C6D9F1E